MKRRNHALVLLLKVLMEGVSSKEHETSIHTKLNVSRARSQGKGLELLNKGMMLVLIRDVEGTGNGGESTERNYECDT